MAEFLQTDLGKTLYTFLIAMLPVVELRGSIPVAAASGLPWPVAMTASVLGNMLPVPFILLFVRRVFRWLKDHNKFAKFIYRLEKRALNKAADLANAKGRFYRYELVALCIFVAIPFPGTGAWTGAMVAALLNLRVKYATLSIFVGVLIAAVLITLGAYGLVAGLRGLFG